MKIFLISDNNDTLEGLRLAGIEGVVVHSAEETLNVLKNAKQNPEIGLILITQKAAKPCREYIDASKSEKCPLIEEIPDRHYEDFEDPLDRYISGTLGING